MVIWEGRINRELVLADRRLQQGCSTLDAVAGTHLIFLSESFGVSRVYDVAEGRKTIENEYADDPVRYLTPVGIDTLLIVLPTAKAATAFRVSAVNPAPRRRLRRRSRSRLCPRSPHRRSRRSDAP